MNRVALSRVAEIGEHRGAGVVGDQRRQRPEVAVADEHAAVDERERLELEPGRDAQPVGVAQRRVQEAVPPLFGGHDERGERRQLPADRARSNRSESRSRSWLRLESMNVSSEVKRYASCPPRGPQDRAAAEAQVDAAAGRERLAPRPRVDFIARPLARVEVVGLAEGRETADRVLDPQLLARAEGALAVVLLEVEVLEAGLAADQAAADPHPEVDLGAERAPSCPASDRRLVEHVGVDAEAR